jgi:phosphatidylserine/phosphatidylglycerophosphate/cardiolipin synthase-like enzyme
MFDQKTTGTCVKFAVDGQQIMGLIHQKIREAKFSIWIANYDLDPDLYLIRESDLKKKHFQQSFDESDLVSSSCQNKINQELDSSISNSLIANYTDHFVLQNLLIQKAKERVDIKIILWEPRLIIRKLPISKQRRGIEGREKKAEIINLLAKNHGVENYIEVRVDSKAPTFTSGYHEKIIIIDNKIGFCGGQDLSKGKWDTSCHSYDNQLRDGGSEPWHDVNVMVQGPVVRYFIFHFNQRWIHSIFKSDKWVKEIVRPDSIGAYLSPYSHLSVPSFASNNENEERIEMAAPYLETIR